MTFEAGAEVRAARSKRIGYVISSNAEVTQVIFSGESGPELVATSSLTLADSEPSLLDVEAFLDTLTAYKLTSQLSNVVYGYLASRTQFRSYQFLPVLRFLESPVRRLLVADEVGLGKTIEAGLIWLELAARQQAERVLVVCPSALREKWRRELTTRFDIDATVITRGAELDQLLVDVDATPELASRQMNTIVSIETLRRDCPVVQGWTSYGQALAESGVIWDLVIVDEAHHARNSSSKTHQAIDALGAATEALVFLTATPLNLGTPDLYNLLRLLSPQRFQSHDAFVDEIQPARHITRAVRAIRDNNLEAVQASLDRMAEGPVGMQLRRTAAFRQAQSLLSRSSLAVTRRDMALLERSIKDLHPLSGVFTRTRKRDLTEPFAQRTVRRVDVDWTDSERRFYDAVIQGARESAHRNPFAVVMPARQTASCLPVMRSRIEESDIRYDAAEGLESLRGGRSNWLEDMSDRSRRSIQAAIGGLAEGVDTKFDMFVTHLRELFAGEVRQALVFSFFRGTIDYLRRRLTTAGFSVDVMHGGVSPDDRYRIMDRFRRGEFQILLSTEVGAEGLDFEFCACLVNYDLPWNPMRVEQRIGRLDRFGQQHERIVIVNFRIPGTIETDIFERLYERIGVFKDSIGDLDDILGDELEDRAFQIAANLRLTPAERERQIEQLAHRFELRRATVEDLESHRDLLAASEELLSEEFDRIRTTGRLINPAEIEALVRSYFAQHYPSTRWGRGGNGQLVLDLDPRLPETDRPLGRALLEPELRHIRQQATMNTPLPCTFDAEEASRSHHVEFFTARHPLVAAIAEQVSTDQLPLRTAFEIEDPRLQSGEYTVGIYEAIVRGVDTRKSLFTIAIDFDSHTRSASIEQHLLGVLAERTDSVQGIAPRELNVTLDQFVTQERSELEERAQIESELAYERRRRAIEATFEPRIQQLEETLEKTRGSRLEAANEGRLRLWRERFDVALSGLERGRNPEVSIRHVATIDLIAIGSTDEPATSAEEVDQPTPLEGTRVVNSDVPQPPDPPPIEVAPSTVHMLCSDCDLGNTAEGDPLPKGSRCANCGRRLTGVCRTCGRFVSEGGCAAPQHRHGIIGDRFTLVSTRQRAEELHFTGSELARTIREGTPDEQVRHTTGGDVTETSYELGTAAVTVSRSGMISRVRRVFRST